MYSTYNVLFIVGCTFTIIQVETCTATLKEEQGHSFTNNKIYMIMSVCVLSVTVLLWHHHESSIYGNYC